MWKHISDAAFWIVIVLIVAFWIPFGLLVGPWWGLGIAFLAARAVSYVGIRFVILRNRDKLVQKGLTLTEEGLDRISRNPNRDLSETVPCTV